MSLFFKRSVTSAVALLCVCCANIASAQSLQQAPRQESALELSVPRAGATDLLAGPKEAQAHFSKKTPQDSLEMHPAAALGGLAGFGVGHLLGGQKKTGLRLMAIQGVSLTTLFLGGLGIVSTGASRRLIYPAALMAVAGGTGFVLSWLSDIIGTVSRGKLKGVALRRPVAEIALGGMWVTDPQFEFGPFVSLYGSVRYKKWEASLDAKVALTTSNQRLGVAGRYFMVGEKARDTSLSIRLGGTTHRFKNEGFRTLTIEASMSGRLNLSVIGPSLRGLFVEGEVGVGFQGIGYDDLGSGYGEDFNAILIARVAYGIYLGDRGEFLVEYNQREDDFAGSVSIDGIGVGVLGHIGIRGRGYFGNGPWGIEAYGEYGSAWIAGINLRYRWLGKEGTSQ